MSSGAALVAEIEKPILVYIEATNSDPIIFPLDQERQRHLLPLTLRMNRISESALLFRSRGTGKVILPRERVEFFDSLNLLHRRPAQSSFLRFSHSSRGLQFG
jgi:hypothetical protein